MLDADQCEFVVNTLRYAQSLIMIAERNRHKPYSDPNLADAHSQITRALERLIPDEDADEFELVDSAMREALGMLVRFVWTEWAMEQPNPKASWLVPWEDLAEPDREVDRRIGEVLSGVGAPDDALAYRDRKMAKMTERFVTITLRNAQAEDLMRRAIDGQAFPDGPGFGPAFRAHLSGSSPQAPEPPEAPQQTPLWHCEAVAVGMERVAGICSPDAPIHTAPCGPVADAVAPTEADRP